MSDLSRERDATAATIAQSLVDFMPNPDWDNLLALVNRQVQALEELSDSGHKTQVFELLQGIDAIHREALRRLVRLFKKGVLEQVVTDPAIHTLMDLYDLLPADAAEVAEVAEAAEAATKPKPRFPTIPIKAVPGLPGARPRYPHWVPALQTGDLLSPQSVREVQVDGQSLLLIRHRDANQADRLFALASSCAQDGASLSGARLNGYLLACPNHAGCYYDVRQGGRIGHSEKLECFPVKTDADGKVLIGLDMDFTPELPGF